MLLDKESIFLSVVHEQAEDIFQNVPIGVRCCTHHYLLSVRQKNRYGIEVKSLGTKIVYFLSHHV